MKFNVDRKMKRRNLTTELSIFFVKLLFSVFMFMPIIWIISGSFKTLNEFTTTYRIIPQFLTLENYEYIFWKSNFLAYVRNTVLLMSLTTIGTLLSSSLVAYPLARINFPGKNMIFGLIIATLMVPEIALIIPKYMLFGEMGWLDSLLPMIIPAWFAHPYNVFLFRQFFRTIPKELDEAASLDGCSRFRAFFSVIAPLAKPIYLTIAVLSSVSWWNELTQPVFYLNSDKWRTLTIATMTSYMYTSGNAFVINWPSIMAISTIMILPPMVLYMSASQFFTEGFKTSGIKG